MPALVTVITHVISYIVFKYSSFIVTITIRTSEHFSIFIACPNKSSTVDGVGRALMAVENIDGCWDDAMLMAVTSVDGCDG